MTGWQLPGVAGREELRLRHEYGSQRHLPEESNIPAWANITQISTHFVRYLLSFAAKCEVEVSGGLSGPCR